MWLVMIFVKTRSPRLPDDHTDQGVFPGKPDCPPWQPWITWQLFFQENDGYRGFRGIIFFSAAWVISFNVWIAYSCGHVLVITGYKWDYTFYKWSYKYL